MVTIRPEDMINDPDEYYGDIPGDPYDTFDPDEYAKNLNRYEQEQTWKTEVQTEVTTELRIFNDVLQQKHIVLEVEFSEETGESRVKSRKDAWVNVPKIKEKVSHETYPRKFNKKFPGGKVEIYTWEDSVEFFVTLTLFGFEVKKLEKFTLSKENLKVINKYLDI